MKNILIVVVLITMLLQINAVMAKNDTFNKVMDNIDSSRMACISIPENIVNGNYMLPSYKINGSWVCEYGWTAEYTSMAYWLNYRYNRTEYNLKKAIAITDKYADNYPKMWDSMNHGFYGMPFIEAYESTHDEKWRALALMSADELVSHYDTKLNIITHWNGTDQVIVDSMPNTILLLWAHNETKESIYLDIANNQANKIIDNMFKDRRKFGALWHARDWTTGNTYNGQADDDNSSWGRGHAWFMYGMQAMYEYTKNPKYLKAFNDVATYWIKNFDDRVIDNSIGSSSGIKDTSGTSISNVAFIRMSRLGYPRLGIIANESIKRLVSPDYLTDNGSLLHGCYNSKIETQQDVELIFGDYYLLESLYEASSLKDSRSENGGKTMN